MPLETGSVLRQRYRIDEVLGQGGMGAVYRAYDLNLGVDVAVKENLFSTEEYARQFRREATILASLRHPNLPRVTDHFVIEGQGQYLVMDYIAGEDLRDRLARDSRVPEKEALKWFLEICDALSYLHTRVPPVLHRDVKPGNIKITPDGRAILVDFGLAKVADDSGSTTTGAKAMTPGFSPPEQYGTGRTDPRTDVYALGATMYATLTGAIPEDSLERAMGREKLTPLRKRNPKISSHVARAVEKALEVNGDQRFQTVANFAAALARGAEASQPTLVRSYPYLDPSVAASSATVVAEQQASRKKARARRRRWPIAALILITLLLIVGGAAYASPAFGARLQDIVGQAIASASPLIAQLRPPTEAPTPAVTATLAAIFDPPTPTPGITPSLTAIPTQRATRTPTVAALNVATPMGGGFGEIAFASERSGSTQIYLMNLDGTNIRQLTELPDGACQPSWSPDGTRLAFTSPCRGNRDQYPGSSLWILDLDTGDIRPLPTAPGGDFDPAWSPDGGRIAFTSLRTNRPQVFLLHLDDLRAERLGPLFARDSQPHWSPSGTELVYVSGRPGPAEVWVMPDTGGSGFRVSLSGGKDDSYPVWSPDGQFILYEQAINGIPRLVVTRVEDRGEPEFRVCPEGPLVSQPMAEPGWSPDGRWIAFETWPTGDNHDVAIITENCSKYSVITSDPSFDFDAAWRPAPASFAP